MLPLHWGGALILGSVNGVLANKSNLPEETQASIVVKGVRADNILKNVPDETFVITSEDIAIQNPQSAFEAIQWIPGITISPSFYGHGDDHDSQTIGGYSSALVLIDGNPTAGNYALSEMSTNNIERIEVIKGGNSLLYGSGAMGGVINIITKKAPDKFTFNLKGTYTTRKRINADIDFKTFTVRSFKKDNFNSSTQDVSVGFKLGNLRQLYSYSRQYVNGEKYKNQSFQGKFGIDLNEKITLGFDVKMDKDEQIWVHRNKENYDYGLKLNWAIDEDSSLQVRLFLRDEDSGYRYRTGNYNEDSLYDEEKIIYTRRLGDRHSLTLGYHRVAEDLDFASADDNWSKRQDSNNFIIQDEIKITDRFLLIPALRVDSHDQWGEKLSPKINVMWRVDDSLTLRTSWGKAFKAPTLRQLYQKALSGHRIWYDGDPNLLPEESRTFRIGAEKRLGKNLFTQISLFRNDFDNIIYGKKTGKKRNGRPIRQFTNTAEAMTQGIEAEMRYYFTNMLSTAIAYTYTDGENDAITTDMIEHRLSPMVRYYNDRIRLSMEVRGEYQRYAENAGSWEVAKSNDNFALHASISKHITDYAKVWLNAYNILNEEKRSGLESNGRMLTFGVQFSW